MQLPIRLDQFLKRMGVAQTGGHAKWLISEGSIRVNGDTETRRGRKLRAGDLVAVMNNNIHLDEEPPNGGDQIDQHMNTILHSYRVGEEPPNDNPKHLQG